MEATRLSFEDAVALLESLQKRGWRLGLDRMQEFLRRMDLEGYLGRHGRPRYFHVAGTNGKGSVTATLQSLLVSQGYRTGAYFSPYVYSIRERVQLDGALISEEEFALSASRASPAARALESTGMGGPTEFEFKTALAMDFWHRMGAEAVALEVGLGGRLDATNVVEPAVAIVASIGYDHMAILGDTLAKIATEKGGIVKTERPLILGDMPEEARSTLLAIAERRRAPTWVFGSEIRLRAEGEGVVVCTPAGEFGPMLPGLFGARQDHNLALAVSALAITNSIRDAQALARGARETSLPGRFEIRPYLGRTFILDGAHNPEAAESTVRNLFEWDRPSARLLRLRDPDEYELELANWRTGPARDRRVTLLSGMLQGHDSRAFFAPLACLSQSVHISPIDFHRSRDPLELMVELGDMFERVVAHRDLHKALAAVLAETREGDTVLVCGSFHLVGEVGTLLSQLGEQGPAV